MEGADAEEQLSQALEYRHSLRRSLFEDEADAAATGESPGLGRAGNLHSGRIGLGGSLGLGRGGHNINNTVDAIIGLRRSNGQMADFNASSGIARGIGHSRSPVGLGASPSPGLDGSPGLTGCSRFGLGSGRGMVGLGASPEIVHGLGASSDPGLDGSPMADLSSGLDGNPMVGLRFGHGAVNIGLGAGGGGRGVVAAAATGASEQGLGRGTPLGMSLPGTQQSDIDGNFDIVSFNGDSEDHFELDPHYGDDPDNWYDDGSTRSHMPVRGRGRGRGGGAPRHARGRGRGTTSGGGRGGMLPPPAGRGRGKRSAASDGEASTRSRGRAKPTYKPPHPASSDLGSQADESEATWEEDDDLEGNFNDYTGHPTWRQLKKSPPEHEELLNKMFRGFVVDGSTALAPRQGLGNDEDIVGAGVNEVFVSGGADGAKQNAPPTVSGSFSQRSLPNNRGGSSSAVTSPMKQTKNPMVRVMKSIHATLEANCAIANRVMLGEHLDEKIAEVLDMAMACGASEGSTEYFMATLLFKSAENRSTFKALKTNEGRLA
ncbi:hypothetical protein PR202_gb10844 [Eleusine coracana subsp. coracana]|uniref:Uncharacterized protein n=1 Tax=Eleusine coracana subsp. coracana TaxID=191504 RepID=A0AAV5ELR7_ELECO|nr:hypothetical protein PR202_gb10844 [Eleusine coracana subsp. coracana]